ncbi:ankyrin [Choiromyces venosus 120613-1]|uniref:Ankyrin n=1 Tax=Choiromyces venosus 120613-1 TaxID=1336337 RepID=A0A3N4JMX7_9PEZI|nr:ankyrin [Choiromyces venosus 120613-1]
MPLAGRPLPFLDIAAEAGNARAVRALLACPRIVVEPRGRGDIYPPALISAVWRGDFKIVKILCEDGRVDVNAGDGGAGENPVLITAAENGHLEIVRYLLRRRDINVEVRSWSAKTALCWAAGGGNLDMVKLLLEEGGASVNLSCGCWYAPWSGGELTSLLLTPLHFAAIGGHLSVVQFLVKCEGVDINARDALGDSPLDYARRGKDKKIVRMLKDNGAIDRRYKERRQFRRNLMGLKIFGCFSGHV